MRYLGGKSRTATAIVVAITGHAAWYGTPTRWVEPFMGGGSVTVAAVRLGAYATVCASDIDPLVVAYWQAIAGGWVPPTVVTNEEYTAVRSDPESHPAEYVAHVAYNCSFGGKRWGSYARGMESDGVTPRRWADESSRRDTAARQWICHAKITRCNYTDAMSSVGAGDVVYCDPPYAGTAGYSTGAFDHAAFWSAAQIAADRGALVYVSEYTCPERVDSEVIWSNEQVKTVVNGRLPRPRVTDNVFFIHPTGGDQ